MKTVMNLSIKQLEDDVSYLGAKNGLLRIWIRRAEGLWVTVQRVAEMLASPVPRNS